MSANHHERRGPQQGLKGRLRGGWTILEVHRCRGPVSSQFLQGTATTRRGGTLAQTPRQKLLFTKWYPHTAVFCLVTLGQDQAGWRTFFLSQSMDPRPQIFHLPKPCIPGAGCPALPVTLANGAQAVPRHGGPPPVALACRRLLPPLWIQLTVSSRSLYGSCRGVPQELFPLSVLHSTQSTP